ncbi:hypothetical protein [Kangiella shandongensis]|uniref:hypothetical protein n=1 Tax=Kangiella shandongensis TaxID=2763258 RepID=UPI001CBFFC25|nr:hypothetical protein [Kangiella shandongensis]
MDQINAGVVGQRTCIKESPYKTERFNGYSYKVGGLCNNWQGQIYNDTKYTIKCENIINGSYANSIFASPKHTTELEHIVVVNKTRTPF